MKVPEKDRCSVVGYSTADSYDLLTLADLLASQDIYEVHHLTTDLLDSLINS